MKKIYYGLSILMGMAILFSSCDKENEGTLYDMPTGLENALTFQVDEGKVEINPDGSGIFTVTVYRLNPRGTVSTELDIMIGDTNVFDSDVTSLTFSDGESSADIVFTYDYETMQFLTDYKISISFDGEESFYIPEYLSEDSTVLFTGNKLITSTNLLIVKALTWTYIGKVYWVSEFWGEEGERDIWLADQVEAYRVEDIFFVDNGKMFQFTVEEDGSIIAVPSQEIWYHATYSAWVCAEDISGYKEGNKFNIEVGWYYMPGVGGWKGPWKETGTLPD